VIEPRYEQEHINAGQPLPHPLARNPGRISALPQRHAKLLHIAHDLHLGNAKTALQRITGWNTPDPGSLTADNFPLRMLKTANPHARVFAFKGTNEEELDADRWALHDPDRPGAQVSAWKGTKFLGRRKQPWSGPTAYLYLHGLEGLSLPTMTGRGRTAVNPQAVTALLKDNPDFTEFGHYPLIVDTLIIGS
jgi:hypothetical protein